MQKKWIFQNFILQKKAFMIFIWCKKRPINYFAFPPWGKTCKQTLLFCLLPILESEAISTTFVRIGNKNECWPMANSMEPSGKSLKSIPKVVKTSNFWYGWWSWSHIGGPHNPTTPYGYFLLSFFAFFLPWRRRQLFGGLIITKSLVCVTAFSCMLRQVSRVEHFLTWPTTEVGRGRTRSTMVDPHNSPPPARM